MTVTFEFKRQYGRERYFPKSAGAVAVCAIGAKACLSLEDLLVLEAGGFAVRVDHGKVENMDWRPRETVE